MPGFERVNPLGEGIVRGPARLLVAPSTIAFPNDLNNIINMAPATAGISGVYAASVQSLTATGTPTAGTFTLAFDSVQTVPLLWTATATQVAAALNALAGIQSNGGVTCTGGPVAGGTPAPVVITFGDLGLQPAITAPVTGNALVGGAGVTAVVSVTTPGNGQYDAVPGSGWADLGSTRSGVQVTRNNTEDQLDIDQVYGSILGVPNEWEMTIATQLAETTLENIQLAWEGGAITVDSESTPNERHIGLGNPLAYTQKKLAVLHQKTIGPAAGLIRAQVFRLVTRSPQNSNLDYQKTGQMQTLAQTFRAYADASVSSADERFGEIIEQAL